MATERSHHGRLTVRAALALGAVHGPTELLPISSSAHTTILPWLVDSAYVDLDADLRKALEVALHAGATAALLVAGRRPLIAELTTLTPRDFELVALASAPAACAGYLFQTPIEDHLGRPPVIAVALVLGAAAMALADRAPEVRNADAADAGDALWLGLAQACALVPGVSRRGATLAMARLRRFRRAEASILSHRLGFPVIIGATALEAWRLVRGGFDPAARFPLGAGMATSFASTLMAGRLVRDLDARRPLWPFAGYRLVLAGTVLAVQSRRRKLQPRAPDQGHGPSA